MSKMFSFIHDTLTRSPTKAQKTTTRQPTIVSAFARVNANNGTKDASTTPSLTTGSSLADNSSDAADEIGKKDADRESSEHLLDSNGDHETAPFGEEGTTPHPSVMNEETADPEETLLGEDGSNSQEDLLQQSVQALDKDWDIGALPGDGMKMPTIEKPAVTRRKSTRLDSVLNQASTALESTKTVLGKRAREAMEAGKETFQTLTGVEKDSNANPKDTEHSSHESPKKRARFSAPTMASSYLNTKSKPTSKKPSKHWLNEGLYVGQSPDFDPRLTETKNRLKKASGNKLEVQKNSVMPLPMFAGARTLENGRDFKLPFDIFSPLSPGQPKPDEYKKTSKNVFVGNAKDEWKKTKQDEHSMCMCNEEVGCNEQCLNRSMLYECDETNCRVGAERCSNRAFAELKERCESKDNDAKKKYNIGVEVLKTKDRGHGVRANRSFEPNQIIIEYTGEIITRTECDNRMKTVYKNAECYYLMEFDQSMVLDATRGSIARFINHSCEPNCRMIKWTVHGKPRMALFAGDAGIMTGEELTYDYNFDPFSAKNVQKCLCGTKDCRGVLGPKPKPIKEPRETSEPIAGGKKRKIQEIGEDLVTQAKEMITKKRKIAIPYPVKSAIAGAKAQTSRRPSQASKLDTANQQDQSSEQQRPTNKLKRKSTVGFEIEGEKEQPAKKSRRKSTVTFEAEAKAEQPAKDSRRKSTGNPLPRGWKGWALVPESPPASPTEEKAEAGTKWEKVPTKDNEERTVRKSSRGTPGKSIRVVALGGDELKEWR